MEPQLTELEQYRQTVQERLNVVLSSLRKAAVGDFSTHLPITETTDEFTPLYLGVNLATEDLKAFFEELTLAKTQLEMSVAAGAGELKKAIIELRQSSARTRSVLDNAGEGIIAINAEGVVLLANRAVLELVQASETSVIGQHCLDVFHCRSTAHSPHQEEPMYNFITRHLQFGEKIVRKFCEIIRRDGSSVPVHIIASPIMVQDAIKGAVIVFRDLSNERALEKTKSDLVSFASHQLLTPLTAIHGYAEVLKEDLADISPNSQMAISRIIDSTEHMKDVINSFLNAAILEEGSFKINKEIVAVSPILTTLVAELSVVGLKKKLQIQSNAGSSSIMILAHPTYLMMVFQNLLSNAIKYTPAGGKIHVRCLTVDDEVVVEIEDTGRGIPDDEKKRIFERMFRATNAKTEHGNGLGLYLVQKIVQLFDGTVAFRSEVDKGTTFTLRFPIAKVDET